MLDHNYVQILSPVRLVSTRFIKDKFVFISQRRSIFSLLQNDNPPQAYSLVKVLPYSNSQLYKVISDIDSYREFVPYCTDSFVSERDKDSNQPRKATLKVGWGSFIESFESELTCREPSVVIAQSNHSMFKVLHTKWQISPHSDPNSSKVSLDIKFSFNNPIYNAASKSFGSSLASLMVKAFENRAADVLERHQEKTR
ncbi:dehydrase and lipid transport-domain-containing protein [Dipodascopsis uninucleata]